MAKMKLSDLDMALSPEELAELEAAEALPPAPDADCPEMTVEQLIQFKPMRNADRNKQTVSLRLSSETLKKARMYGKGYTSFLSRLLDEAIKDEALVRRCI